MSCWLVKTSTGEMNNCVGVFVLVAAVVFLGLVVAEAGYPSLYEPYSHTSLKYYGGHTPGPSEYEKTGEFNASSRVEKLNELGENTLTFKKDLLLRLINFQFHFNHSAALVI